MTAPVVLVLLVDDHDRYVLVAAPAEQLAEEIGYAAVFGDAGISAWRVPTHAATDADGVLRTLRADGSLDEVYELAETTARPVLELLLGLGLDPVEYDRADQPLGDVLLNPAAFDETGEHDDQDDWEQSSALRCRYCGSGCLSVIEYRGFRYPIGAVLAVPGETDLECRAQIHDLSCEGDFAADQPMVLLCPNGHELVRPDWLELSW